MILAKTSYFVFGLESDKRFGNVLDRKDVFVDWKNINFIVTKMRLFSQNG